LPFETLRQQFLRMVFNVLARNIDDHSKNVAFCMYRSGSWHLSPAYNLRFRVDLVAPGYANKQLLTVGGKNEGITQDDLEKLGIENDLPNCKILIEQVTQAISSFRNYASNMGVDQRMIVSIEERLVNRKTL
jgi:serine/threonine-protein kinase HipA